MNPTELGYCEKRAGSGVWYRLDGVGGTFEPRVCENPLCSLPGGKFMARRGKVMNKTGRRQFCSLSCARRTPDPGYGGRHDRIYRKRGNASQFPCVDGCGRQAEDWSQTHGMTGLDPEHYDPRCRPCHRAYDADSQSRGEGRPAAKLTEARVRGIRASVGATLDEMAKIHGVKKATIGKVRRREVWQHVE